MNFPGGFQCLGLADPNNVCIGDNNPCLNNPFGLTECVVTENSYECLDKNECETKTHACAAGKRIYSNEGGYFLESRSFAHKLRKLKYTSLSQRNSISKTLNISIARVRIPLMLS